MLTSLSFADAVVFGSRGPKIDYAERRAAYLVSVNAGKVAMVGSGRNLFLPGGGSLPGETPEMIVAREVREELGRGVQLVHTVCRAVQYFYSADDDCHYEMRAVFFAGELTPRQPNQVSEHSLKWLPIAQASVSCFHECHAWAIHQSRDLAQRIDMNQKPDVMIRRANLEDAGLLADLGARTFGQTFASDNTPEDMAAYIAASFNLAQQTAELSDPASTFLIAEVNGLAAGYAMLRAGEAAEGVEGSKPVELVRLYVSREWLGRGVGAVLMNACLNEAQQAGHKTIWLGVWERNGRAQAFYRKWNFRAVGEHVFQLGSDPQRDILMERAV